MPAPLSGAQIDGHQAFAEQIVARSMPAIIIRGRGFHRQIHQPEFRIGADMGPHTGVAVISPGSILPCLIAEFARTGNGVETPKLLARAHIEGAHKSLVLSWVGTVAPSRMDEPTIATSFTMVGVE